MVVHPYICTTAIYSLVASKIYFNWVNEGSPQARERWDLVFSFFFAFLVANVVGVAVQDMRASFRALRPTFPVKQNRAMRVAGQRRGHAINENVFRELLQKFIVESSQPDQIIPDFRCIFIGAPWVPFPKVHQDSWVWSHRNQRGQVASCSKNQVTAGVPYIYIYIYICPKRRGNGAKYLRGTLCLATQAWIEDVPRKHSARWHPKSAWKCPAILKEKNPIWNQHSRTICCSSASGATGIWLGSALGVSLLPEAWAFLESFVRLGTGVSRAGRPPWEGKRKYACSPGSLFFALLCFGSISQWVARYPRTGFLDYPQINRYKRTRRRGGLHRWPDKRAEPRVGLSV